MLQLINFVMGRRHISLLVAADATINVVRHLSADSLGRDRGELSGLSNRYILRPPRLTGSRTRNQADGILARRSVK
jgi:hypothetical protein